VPGKLRRRDNGSDRIITDCSRQRSGVFHLRVLREKETLHEERQKGRNVAHEGEEDRRGIDPSLRERVTEQISIVTDALDAATTNPTDDALDELREAADKLMRALGRVLIEIERQRGGSQQSHH